MALSPNYGFPEPDNSSLVKNGAQDIRALGDAVDTAVWNVGFGQAGKNKFINGDCRIAQRGATFTNAADGAYTLDRWQFFKDGTASVNVTQETFTPGTAPVAGYEASNYMRLTPSSYTSGNIGIRQNIEDVRTFAGQTVTISFWAKASASTSNTILYLQNFGSGGSGSVNAAAGSVTITTSWARYSVSVAIPSVSGKTIGTSSYLMIQILRYAANATVDVWGMQIEYGSKATPFQTASGGSPQQELAMCQRYYARIGFPYVTNNAPGIAVGRSYSTTGGDAIIPLSVPLRTVATSVDYSGLQFNDQNNTTYSLSAVSLNSNQQPNVGMITMTSTGMTANRMGWLIGSAGANTGYIGFSAEL